MTSNLTCPCCRSPLLLGDFEWLQYCATCKYEHSNLVPTLNNAADSNGLDEAHRENALEPLRKQNFLQLAKICTPYLTKGQAILDVGCAHGWFLDQMKTDYQVSGIEPDSLIANQAKLKGHNIHVGLFPDVLDRKDLFSAIFFNDVFEHIDDPEIILAEVRSHLQSKGILVVSLPSSKGFFYRTSRMLSKIGISSFRERLWQKGMPSPHIHYFHKDNLSRLLERQGFVVLNHSNLASTTTRGLFSRIRMSNDFGLFLSSTLYLLILAVTPLIKILPSDALVLVCRKQ